MTHPLWLHLQRKYNSVLLTARNLFLFILVAMLSACADSRWDVDLSEVDKSTSFHRFEVDFYSTDSTAFSESIGRLSEEYPYFFANNDSVLWHDQRFDRQLNMLWKDVRREYSGEAWQSVESELSNGFKRYYHHFPSATEKEVYTYISSLDFSFPTLYVDSIRSVFIAVDTYLGEDYPAYASIPNYIKRRFTKHNIAPDVMESIAASHMPAPSDESALVEDMVRAGVIRYFQSKVLLEKPLHHQFGYTAEQLEFCEANEVNIWMYFVQKQLLFDSSLETKRRFVMEAPFSKFYTDIDNQTPGRIAEWVGFKIVSSYMDKHPEMTLKELFQVSDYRAFFRDSGYKPS